jgi:2-keto-myo-inositol isomerase
MNEQVTRRDLLATGGLLLGAGMVASQPRNATAATTAAPDEPFGYCFNTSTIRGQKLGIVEELEIVAKAGYQGVEPWMREIDKYVAEGGSLKDLRKRIEDLGLTVESAIGFAQWIVDDDAQRAKGLEQAKKDMSTLAQIGGKRIAAPPVGATKKRVDPFDAAQRYGELLKLGEKMGVIPQVEVWGFSKMLNRLGESVMVAIESGHPQACLLPDIYHIFKGGSEFTGLQLLAGSAIQVFHINDYPATPERAEMSDAHRVYPGDGVAPLDWVFQTLYRNGFRGILSLELFNREYWKQDAASVAKTGLEKMRTAVRKSMSAK